MSSTTKDEPSSERADAGAGPSGTSGPEQGPDLSPAAEPAETLATLVERLAAVERATAEFHHRSAHREMVIDRLHEENQELRGGQHRMILEPVVADLLRLYDALLREAGRLTAEAADESDQGPGKLLASFADDALLALERCGLEEYTAHFGEAFDPARHTALAVVPATDGALDNTVAVVVTTGFIERATGRVRRPVRAHFHQSRPAEQLADAAPEAPEAPEAPAP